MSDITLGELVKCTGIFKNQAGALVDPSNVFFEVIAPETTKVSYQYGAGPEVVRDSLGTFSVLVSANKCGAWNYRFYATGTGQGAQEGAFQVKQSVFD